MITWTIDRTVSTIQYGRVEGDDKHFTLSKQCNGVFHLFYGGKLLTSVHDTTEKDTSAKAMAEAYARSPSFRDRIKK